MILFHQVLDNIKMPSNSCQMETVPPILGGREFNIITANPKVQVLHTISRTLCIINTIYCNTVTVSMGPGQGWNAVGSNLISRKNSGMYIIQGKSFKNTCFCTWRMNYFERCKNSGCVRVCVCVCVCVCACVCVCTID